MSSILIESQPDAERLAELGVSTWPIWEKAPSRFPWRYDEREICYVLEGEVEVTPEGGETVRFGTGDLVTFPAGMACHWRIQQAVRKHYRFG